MNVDGLFILMAEGEGIEPPRRCRRHLSKVLHYRSANLPDA